MTAKYAFNRRSLSMMSIVACMAGATLAAQAQTAISVLPPVYVRLSASSTGTGSSAVNFSTSTQNLTCPASGIVATVSSTTDGTGNVLVDNFINLTVAQGTTTTTGPTNICRGGIIENGNQADCFTAGYQGPASNGQLTGDDPDGAIAAAGGVTPIDISSQLASGANTLTFDLVDTGGYLASTSIYLYTNCTSQGIVGGGQITGNSIPSSNPPADVLTQNFAFSAVNNKGVQQVLDFSYAAAAQTLTVENGTIPTVVDLALDPATWSNYVKGTSFATSQCLVHNGELLDNNSPACKLYTVTCQVGQGSTGSGAQCPSSSARNILFEDIFDGPEFYLPDIHAGHEVFHQGFGYLEASDGWTGGPCTFENASEQIFSCPENLLVQFTGPGATKTTSSNPVPHINSTFISVGPVPEDRTKVRFEGSDDDDWGWFWKREKWVNSREVQVKFLSKPPIVPPPNNGFVAAPIYGITYGVSLANALPSTEFPVPGDLTLYTAEGCPAPGTIVATPFSPEPVPVSVDADGNYLIHYFATDCAGTEELFFYKDNTNSWNTTFFTKELNVDTVNPTVVAGPTLSPAPTLINGVLGYKKGQKVTATYQCSDDRSGVEQCGEEFYCDPVTNPAAVKTTINTWGAGQQTFTVKVSDAAENEGQSASVSYTVVGGH
jgi:hypothetical protein